MRGFWLLVAFLAAFTLGIAADRVTQSGRPVCHSTTEDAPITDCDYRDGAWYPR